MVKTSLARTIPRLTVVECCRPTSLPNTRLPVHRDRGCIIFRFKNSSKNFSSTSTSTSHGYRKPTLPIIEACLSGKCLSEGEVYAPPIISQESNRLRHFALITSHTDLRLPESNSIALCAKCINFFALSRKGEKCKPQFNRGD